MVWFKGSIFPNLWYQFCLCQFAGLIGSVFTASSLENWYLFLEKPALQSSSLGFLSSLGNTLYAYGNLTLPRLGRKGCKSKRLKRGCSFSAFS